MKSVKTLCLCLALVFVGTCFAACGERRPQGEETFTYEQLMAKFDGEIEQNATIRVLDNQMAIETGHLEEVLDAFNEKYKEYNVNAVDANMDQYVDLEQNGPDGYGPDVLYQANDMLMRYAEGGHVLPLPTEKLDIEEIPDSVMEAYELETYGLDLYYGMPVAQQSTVLTYRKDLLPDNWETEWDDNKNSIPDMVENINDLYAYSAQVKSESNGSKYGLYMSLVDQYFNSGYLLSYGAYVFGDTHDDIGLNADGAEIGLNLFRDLAGVLGSRCISQDATTQVATYLTDKNGTVFCTIWSEQEFWKVHAQMDEKLYRYFFLFMYLMGTRKGEALALTWQDVDFERQEVRINKSLNRKRPQQGEDIVLAENPTPSSMGWHILNSRSYEITTPKNITSNRKVWMTELVVKALKELREESEHDYDFAETDFVFGGKLPLSDQTVRRRMDQYADKAGVKRIRVHDLRHSHASLVISKGLKIEDLILLSKRLGHRDVKETLNTYSHLFPNAQKKILESIDEGAEM